MSTVMLSENYIERCSSLTHHKSQAHIFPWHAHDFFYIKPEFSWLLCSGFENDEHRCVMAMSVHRRRDRSMVIHYVVLRLLHRARRVAGSYPGHVWPAAGHAHPSRPTRTTALVWCNLLHPVLSLPAITSTYSRSMKTCRRILYTSGKCV